MQKEYIQNSQEYKNENILNKYWIRWKQWMEDMRRQRYEAMRLLQYQNQLQDRRLKQCFKLWQQVILQQKIQRFNALKQSIIAEQDQYDNQQQHQQQGQRENKQKHYQDNDIDSDQQNDKDSDIQNDDDDQMYKLGLAIKYHQRKTYAKSLRSLIQYGICSKKFQKKLSRFYINYILKKYLNIINNYKIISINKKQKKAQTLIDKPYNVNDKPHHLNDNSIKYKQQSLFDSSQYNPVKTTHNFTQISKSYSIQNNQLSNNFIYKQNVTTKKQPQQQNLQSNTVYEFKRNPIMAQSRKSQFSTVSANLNYQSKRKFKPIMQLPSIPDIETITKRQTDININKLQSEKYVQKQSEKYVQKQKSPFYESRAQSQTAPYEINRQNNLAQSKVTQIQQENTLRQKILEAILKQKLITLTIISGQQFQQGMQYQNYREKTLSTLRKIKDIKII